MDLINMSSIVVNTSRKEKARLSMDWTISKFKEKMDTAEPGEMIELENVKVGESEWNFELYANGEVLEDKGAVSIFCISKNETSTTADVSFTVMGQGLPQCNIFSRKFNHNFTKSEDNSGFSKFFMHDDVENNEKRYLTNGRLQLVINMTVYGDEETTVQDKESQNLESITMSEKLKVGEYFKDCWNQDYFSDVKIKCRGITFHCHRIVLAKRSNYFKTMLESDFKESQTGVIDLDVDVETFRAVLKYIYEGVLDTLETNAMELLEASERFELANVKNICEQFIIANYLKLENVIDTLLTADLFKAKTLKQAAMDIIVANSELVIKQQGWKEKLERSNKLFLEVFEAIATKK